MLNRSHLVWWWSSVDILIATLAILASLQFQTPREIGTPLATILALRLTLKNFLILAVFLVLWTGIHQLCGLYSGPARRRRYLVLKTLAATGLGSAFYLLFPLFSHEHRPIAAPVVVFFAVALLLSLVARLAAWPRTAHAAAVREIIVGSGPLALRLYRSLLEDCGVNHEIVGFVDDPGTHPVPAPVSERLIGTVADLERLLVSNHIDEVQVALPLRSCYDRIQECIAICDRVGVPVTYHFQPFAHTVGISCVTQRAFEPYISHRPSRVEQSRAAKRAIDVAVASCALVAFAPLFAFIALAVRLTSRGPVFFTQERYGLNRQRFRMYKFRTMVPDAEARQAALESSNEAAGPVFKIRNDPRVTPLGRLLRKTSLDELPQLINVLRGEMSVVGPRPLPLRDVANFNEAAQMRRFSVKPGLTCLWQISGRSNTSFDQWIAFDLEYIDTWSPLLDFKILLLTIPAVLRGSGAM